MDTDTLVVEARDALAHAHKMRGRMDPVQKVTEQLTFSVAHSLLSIADSLARLRQLSEQDQDLTADLVSEPSGSGVLDRIDFSCPGCKRSGPAVAASGHFPDCPHASVRP